MSSKLKKLCEPLPIDQIDFRIININKGGYATITPYKDARADMERLDAVFGPGGWQRTHTFKNGLNYCSVGAMCDGAWIWKEDVGVQSNTEKEKGEASDSFKRACVNWGIGRELYDYPSISIKLNQDSKSSQYGEWFLDDRGKPKSGYGLKIKEWQWISEFKDGKIIYLCASDQNGEVRFTWGSSASLAKAADSIVEYINCRDYSEGERLSGVSEIWSELSEDQKRAAWVAKTKGGFFSQEHKEFIRKAAALKTN